MARKNDHATKARYITRRILYDGAHDGSAKIYDPDFHPDDIVVYFTERYEKMQDPERFKSRHALTYVQEPVRPPTFSGYAAEVGVSTKTLWQWKVEYEAFEDSMGICKAMQEAMIIEMSACKAYDPRFAALMMKNMHDWQDKVEQTHKGGVTLNFDAQDKEA